MQPSKTHRIATRIISTAALWAVSLVALAQTGPGNGSGDQGPGSGGGLTNPLGSTSDLPTLLNAILTFITTKIGPVIVTLMLVYCGFLFVTARGNEENIRTARTALLWTVVGALILLGATALQSVITATIGTL